MQFYVCLLVIIISTTAVKCANEEDKFENSTEICSKCKCQAGAGNKFYLNCTDTEMTNTLANWPKETDSPSLLLIATFSYNHIKRLNRMAGTSANLKISYDHCGIEDLASDLFKSCSNVTFFDLSFNNLES